jgi:hypothetical protein
VARRRRQPVRHARHRRTPSPIARRTCSPRSPAPATSALQRRPQGDARRLVQRRRAVRRRPRRRVPRRDRPRVNTPTTIAARQLKAALALKISPNAARSSSDHQHPAHGGPLGGDLMAPRPRCTRRRHVGTTSLGEFRSFSGGELTAPTPRPRGAGQTSGPRRPPDRRQRHRRPRGRRHVDLKFLADAPRQGA